MREDPDIFLTQSKSKQAAIIINVALRNQLLESFILFFPFLNDINIVNQAVKDSAGHTAQCETDKPNKRISPGTEYTEHKKRCRQRQGKRQDESIPF
jgi:hypothetical protein